MTHTSRRAFLQSSLLASGSTWFGSQFFPLPEAFFGNRPAFADNDKPGSKMHFGLVTYLWGQDWDLPTLITNCEATGILGVELRSTHAHGVEPTLNAAQRKEVQKRFADSNVINVGLGSNERFDNPDPAVVEKAIAATKEFLVLSHEIGSSGVKVKPDRFHEGVPHEKTIAQIGESLNQLGEFAADLGQQVRLEVHGQAGEPRTIDQIMQIADHPCVVLCWNSNPEDLQAEGLTANFKLLKDRFGATCHVHALDDVKYPYADLMTLLVEMDYDGWVLLEASDPPQDRIAALKHQLELFNKLRAAAQSK